MDLDKYNDLFEAAGKQYNVSPQLLRAVASVESSGDPRAVSGAGAQGLMQIMPQTAQSLGVQDSFDPTQAVPGAAKLMRENLDRYGSVPAALMAYNAGTDQSKWNPQYVQKVAQAHGAQANMPQTSSDPFGDLVAQAQRTTAQPQALAQGSPTASNAGDDPFGDLVARTAQTIAAQKSDKEKDTPGFVNGVVRSLANGATFGYADKLDALTDNLLTGKPYDKAIAQQRQMDSNFSDEHPLLAPVTEVAGGLGGMVAGTRLAGAVAPVVEAAAPGVAATAGRAAQAVSSLPSVAKAALAGSGMGALSGAGNTDGSIEDQAKAALAGGAVGGAAGGALGAAAPVLVGAANRAIVQPLMDRFGSGPATAAGRKLAQALQRDGITPEQLQNRLTQLGPDAAVVDAGGANVRNLGEVAASTPGAPAQRAEQFLEGRMEGQGARINQAINSATGSDANFHASVDGLMQQRAADAAPLYEKALNSGPVTGDRVNQFLADPIAKQGLKQGLEIQRLEALAKGEPFNPHDYAITDFNEAGDPVMGAVPNMRTLDAVKRGMDNILEGYRDTTTGQLVLDQRGRAIDQVRKAFVKELDGLNPDYAAARASWSGPSQAMDALASGRSFLSRDPEVISGMVKGMSPSEREMFQVGVARALKDKVSGAADGADATRKMFGNDLIRQKIAAAFGSEDAFQQFQNSMDREAQFANTRNQVLRGSQTARRLAGQQEAPVDPGFLSDLMHGHYMRAAGGAARGIYSALTRPPAEQAEQLGNLLFAPGGQDALPAITSRTQALQANAALRNKLLFLGSGEVGSGAAQRPEAVDIAGIRRNSGGSR